MEDNVQRIFSILLAVLMFFLLPLYIAFEKKDDISYNLALQITTNFVNSVTEKGYLTYDMYNDFITELTTTGNVYDIKLEYIAKEYNPIIQITGVKDGKSTILEDYEYIFKRDDYNRYITSKEENIFSGVENKENYDSLDARITYKMSEYRYFTDQILSLIDPSDTSLSTFIAENEYENYATHIEDNSKKQNSLPAFPRLYGLADEGLLAMNEGDQFNVIIKNENITIATVLFNTLTFGANSDNTTKVYINYGGTIKNQEYMVRLYGDVDDNGVVNEEDYNLVSDYVNNNGSLILKEKLAADCDRNGVVNDDDLDYIRDLAGI